MNGFGVWKPCSTPELQLPDLSHAACRSPRNVCCENWLIDAFSECETESISERQTFVSGPTPSRPFRVADLDGLDVNPVAVEQRPHQVAVAIRSHDLLSDLRPVGSAATRRITQGVCTTDGMRWE